MIGPMVPPSAQRAGGRPVASTPRRIVLAPLAPWALLLASATPTLTAEVPAEELTADLSFVQTSGNSSASTLGFKLGYARRWSRMTFSVQGGGVRTETRETARTAVGSGPDDWRLAETTSSRVSADNDHAEMELTRRVSGRLSWLAGASWTRDRPAGVDGRFVENLGLEHHLVRRDGLDLKLSGAATLTQERSAVENPDARTSFPGMRVGLSYKHAVTASTTLSHELLYDLPLSVARDFRFDARAGVQVAITRSGSLALKADFRLQYDNMPALEELPLVDLEGTPLEARVTRERERVDTQATVALVVNLSRKRNAPQENQP
jgi:hypothetical protein